MGNFINLFYKSYTCSTVQKVHCFYGNPESSMPRSKNYPLGPSLRLMNLHCNIELYPNNTFLNTHGSHK
jgi:hypothetical protein